jgi:DNA-binding IclR family transcriptional regulator
MVCIAREESPAAIGFSVQVGFRPPLLQSTSGRVYFGFQDRARQKLLLRRIGTQDPDPAELQAFVRRARTVARQGYTQEPSLLTAGIEDLSAPIFGSDSAHAIACLTIPFISHLLFPMTTKQALPLLLDATRQISHRLQGGRRG